MGGVGDLGNAAEIGGVFIDAIDGSGAKGAHGERRLAVAANHDHRRGVAAPGEFAENLEAVKIRHHQIEQNQIEGLRGHRGQTRAAGADVGEHGITMRLEEQGDHLRDLGVVFSVQHAEGSHRGGCGLDRGYRWVGEERHGEFEEYFGPRELQPKGNRRKAPQRNSAGPNAGVSGYRQSAAAGRVVP